jgi:peroxiredoxin
MQARYSPGHTFPDYVLPDHTRTPRRLSELQGDDPMLLVLIRGFRCPQDRAQLKELTRFQAQWRAGSLRLVVISAADDWESTCALRQQLGAHYPFLYDPEHRVRDELAIAECGDSAHQPMIPHTVLLAPRLQIHRVWNGHYHWGRPSTCELHDALCEVLPERRQDWGCDAGSVHRYGAHAIDPLLHERADAYGRGARSQRP